MAQAQAISFNAAADFLGPGAIEINMYEREILDVVRRDSVALKRIRNVPATGHPHRYFEETSIGTAAAVDPRNLSSAVTAPTRIERSAFIKAVTSQTNIGMFDKEVTEQQGQFEYIVARDIDDVLNAVQVKRASMLWAGSDTSLTTPTTLEWMGMLPQIAAAGTTGTTIQTCAPGVSIIDTLKNITAQLLAQVGYVARPTAIYANPILLDYVDQEAKAQHIDLKTREVVAGVSVKYLSTQAGDLPLIGDPYLTPDAAAKYGFSIAAGNKNYYAVILTEDLVEIPYISGKERNENPRLFQLGLTGNLAGQFVGVKFDALIVKGPGYAHGLVAIQRI